jgi:hypothetical protein
MVLPILISVSLTPGPYFFSAAHTNETLAKTAVKAMDASQWFLMLPSRFLLLSFVDRFPVIPPVRPPGARLRKCAHA